jgi:hypothetical protein
MQVVVLDDKVTVKQGDKTMEATIKLDETKKPKEIDMTITEGGQTEVHLGIYQLDGDTWKVCKSHPPQERPTELATTEGPKWPTRPKSDATLHAFLPSSGSQQELEKARTRHNTYRLAELLPLGRMT